MEDSNKQEQTIMENFDESFGKPITVTEANDEIQNFINVQNELKPIIANSVLSAFPLTTSFITDLASKNIFVFDKELIERFENTDISHYVVCLGQVEGSATVLLAGCKMIKEEGKPVRYIASNVDDKPISEHPPKQSIIKFEEHPFNGGSTISFTVL